MNINLLQVTVDEQFRLSHDCEKRNRRHNDNGRENHFHAKSDEDDQQKIYIHITYPQREKKDAKSVFEEEISNEKEGENKALHA